MSDQSDQSFTSFASRAPSELLADMIADYQARQPGWLPERAAPEVILMAVFAARESALLDRFGQVLDAIYIRSGTTIDNVAFIAAQPAVGSSTVTLTDDLGHTIPAGLTFDATAGDGTTYRFAVAADVDVAPGLTTGIVTVTAVEPGAQANDLTGALTPAAPMLDYVASAVLNAATSAGADAESVSDYIDRLRRYRQRSSPKLVRARDFQDAALDVPGCARCLVLDLYVPPTPGPEAFDVPGAVTLVPIDAAGADVAGAVLTAVQAATQDPSLNLLDLDVYVIGATRTAVAVDFTATALPTYDPALVQTDAIAAVEAFLSGAQWGSFDPSGRSSWRETLTVRHGDLYYVLKSVDGLDAVTDLKVNGVTDDDATLTGPGALPDATVTGTVT